MEKKCGRFWAKGEEEEEEKEARGFPQRQKKGSGYEGFASSGWPVVTPQSKSQSETWAACTVLCCKG